MNKKEKILTISVFALLAVTLILVVVPYLILSEEYIPTKTSKDISSTQNYEENNKNYINSDSKGFDKYKRVSNLPYLNQACIVGMAHIHLQIIQVR